jgi:hypothetical protein
MKKKFKDANIEVVATDLRALLFWATVGVNGAVDGQYGGEIEEIIRSYSDYLGIRTNTARFRHRATGRRSWINR